VRFEGVGWGGEVDGQGKWRVAPGFGDREVEVDLELGRGCLGAVVSAAFAGV
jgi:hypothetical protein